MLAYKMLLKHLPNLHMRLWYNIKVNNMLDIGFEFHHLARNNYTLGVVDHWAINHLNLMLGGRE
jgi:hypothetical protein